MTIFHANIIIEPRSGADQAAVAQQVYDDVVKLLIAKGVAALGSLHAAPDKGCGCNLLDSKSLGEAVLRGAKILEERGQVLPTEKPKP